MDPKEKRAEFETAKASELVAIEALLAEAYNRLYRVGAAEEVHGYATAGGACDKTLAKLHNAYTDVRVWRRYGDHRYAMMTSG